MPEYSTGISQPANGTMRAPSETWRACRAVFLIAVVSSCAMRDAGRGRRAMPNIQTVLCGSRAGQGAEVPRGARMYVPQFQPGRAQTMWFDPGANREKEPVCARFLC